MRSNASGNVSRRRALGAIALAALAPLAAAAGCGAPSTWQQPAHDLPGGVLSVWGRAADDVYFVGSDARDGTGPVALHFDGRGWQRLATGVTDGDLWWVHGFAAGPIYMVGRAGVVLRYDPDRSTFERMATPGAPTLFGAWGAAPNDLWAVGGAPEPAAGVRAAALWHFDGATWTDATTALPTTLPPDARLFKVWGSSAADVWAVGERGVAVHWDGSAWSDVGTGQSVRVLTLHGNGATRVAVGGAGRGVLLEGDGAGWRTADFEDLAGLNGVFVRPGGDAFAVGERGLVLRRAGGTWQYLNPQVDTSLDFHAVWVDPSGGVWAVGGQIAAAPAGQGMVWHFGAAVPAM